MDGLCEGRYCITEVTGPYRGLSFMGTQVFLGVQSLVPLCTPAVPTAGPDVLYCTFWEVEGVTVGRVLL